MNQQTETEPRPSRSWLITFLAWVERIGNRLGDPAVLFVILLGAVWVLSAVLSGYEFSVPAGEGLRLLVLAVLPP